jgi:hypothetical protein
MVENVLKINVDAKIIKTDGRTK